MPEPGSTVRALQEQAVANADLFLTSSYGALRLAKSEFVAEAKCFRAGWSLLIQPSTRERELHLYLDSSFPFSRPAFFLRDRPEFLTWPHIENSGKLCLLDDIKITHPEHVEEILCSEITDAFRLVDESESETNQPDFQLEFHSYWNRQASLSKRRVYSLLEPHGPSRPVRFWHGKRCCVAGETEEQISKWLRHRHGKKSEYEDTDAACLLWLVAPLLPRDYPRTAADLYRIAESADRGAHLLRSLAIEDRPPFPILLGAESRNGACLAAVLSYRPNRLDPRGARSPVTRPGFRPGKVPPNLQAQHVFSAAGRVEPIEVERVDGAWVHGRDHDPRQRILAQKRVILAGCGSVGAPIAQQLAMAGVGRLTLVDPERLTWANIGRHPLGSKFIDQHKAIALSECLQENLPHLEIDGFVGTFAEYSASRSLSDVDLIICATADWNSERLLNLDHVDRQISCPLLFTWTELHACAGHALYLPAVDHPCLQCGLTPGGDMKEPVTSWPKDVPSYLSEPACGAHFQPYGPIELMGTVSVAASLSLDALLQKLTIATHRIWIGPYSLLQEAGGSWSQKWFSEHSDRKEGAFQETIPWQEDPACCACGHIDPQA